MPKKINKVSDVKVDKSQLLQKGYSAQDLTGKTFIIEDMVLTNGDMGEYGVMTISGEGLEAGKKLTTGATNIMAKLKAAIEQNLFPLEVTIIKHGNAFDIV